MLSLPPQGSFRAGYQPSRTFNNDPIERPGDRRRLLDEDCTSEPHFVLQGKGGVGKTVVSLLLARVISGKGSRQFVSMPTRQTPPSRAPMTVSIAPALLM